MKNLQKRHVPIKPMEADYPEDEFRFIAEISNKDLDSHNSRFDDASLENFVREINNGGVALLNSHGQSNMEDNWGRWIEAKREGDKVIAVASMLRSNESTPAHLNVDEHIRRIERGYYRSVSVGFHGGQDICDLCDDEVFNFMSESKCNHWPGQEYTIDGQKKKATYEIRGANLSECSLVFDGSNDNANILSVRNAPQEIVNWKNKLSPVGNLSELEQIGKKYKQDLIDKLITEAVRALGSDFDEESKRKQVDSWSVEAIQSQTSEYEKMVPFTGGRKTTSGTETSTGSTRLPSWIYG